MIIELSHKDCVCGRRISTRAIDIKQFKKDMFPITETTLRIWNDKKCCWKCKKKPQIGERWGMSINYNERNRLFCPICAEYVEKEIEKKS